MTAIDISQFQNMTQEKFIAYAHNQTAVPSLIVLWLFTMIVLFAAGYPSVSNKGKFLGIFFITFIASGILLVSLLFLPNAYHSLFVWIKSFFSF